MTQTLSRSVHVPIREDKLNYFKFPLTGFQKFFLFWVAGFILEAWDVELENAHFFVVMPSEKHSVKYNLYEVKKCLGN